MIKVFTPGYFAREDTRTPMRFAVIAVGVNIALALSLFPLIHEAGIATAEATAGWINASLLFLTLRRRGHFVVDGVLLRRLPRLVLSCAIMGAALYRRAYGCLRRNLSRKRGSSNRRARSSSSSLGGALIYFAAAQITGAADVKMLARNFRRRPPAPPQETPTGGK